ncbi:MAG: phosphate ABC transporter permease PstA [Candidatus Bipolaricaulota bacterium]|nr:phosphate ABC transporter permease PstA [Candidatus Bipolaricaulota bacterium]
MIAQIASEGQRRKRTIQRIAFALLTLSTVSAFVALGAILYSMISNGASALSWEFLVEFPRKMMTEGGIYPALVGSFYLTVGAVLLSLPFAVASAIWLSEYSRGGLWVRIIRVGVNSLAGVPSIVFGLLGLAFFVKVLRLGVSLLAGALTLALLILPILIRAGEEALQAVPMNFREGALALGATKWHAVRTVVLPSALPGILTGVILGVSRAIGETAPIMFTAAAFYMSRLPETLSDKVMALPYHIFVMATESPNYFKTRNLQFGAALVLLGMVLLMNLGAVTWRARVRRRKQW